MMEGVRMMMVNELAGIGVLIRDLKKDSEVEVTGCMIAEVDRELNRVGQMLLTVWSEKNSNMEYYIDFHYSEALRLFYSIGPADIYHGVQGLPVDLKKLQYGTMYLAISAGLTELMMDLMMMK